MFCDRVEEGLCLSWVGDVCADHDGLWECGGGGGGIDLSGD